VCRSVRSSSRRRYHRHPREVSPQRGNRLPVNRRLASLLVAAAALGFRPEGALAVSRRRPSSSIA
jgi:hypothetical protein